MRDYVVGDLILEVLGVWTLVLVGSGLYLFWPRRSARSQGSKGARRLFGVRWAAGGRARRRDLHGLAGFVMIPIMVLTIVSDMAWSSYWADGFSSLAERLTPSTPAENTASTSATRGDLDRFGNQIPWATGDFVNVVRGLSASTASGTPEALPDFPERASGMASGWWRGHDLNLRPSGDETVGAGRHSSAFPLVSE
jgi:hypothetical protein